MQLKQKQKQLGQTEDELKKLKSEANSFESDFKRLGLENEQLQKKHDGFKEHEDKSKLLAEEK